MPIHSYRCPLCTNEFDKKVPFNDIPEHVRCTICGTQSYRVIQVPNMHYRGSGFASTDKPKSTDPFNKDELDKGMEKTVK